MYKNCGQISPSRRFFLADKKLADLVQYNKNIDECF